MSNTVDGKKKYFLLITFLGVVLEVLFFQLFAAHINFLLLINFF